MHRRARYNSHKLTPSGASCRPSGRLATYKGYPPACTCSTNSMRARLLPGAPSYEHPIQIKRHQVAVSTRFQDHPTDTFPESGRIRRLAGRDSSRWDRHLWCSGTTACRLVVIFETLTLPESPCVRARRPKSLRSEDVGPVSFLSTTRIVDRSMA
ncbi:hypothetical protein PENSPDRAFT_88612 [Peniophora sp. CONT]|nr:hypothetical protein PENSPDRAFT_88612 [Peniophora sp. CONT]